MVLHGSCSAPQRVPLAGIVKASLCGLPVLGSSAVQQQRYEKQCCSVMAAGLHTFSRSVNPP